MESEIKELIHKIRDAKEFKSDNILDIYTNLIDDDSGASGHLEKIFDLDTHEYAKAIISLSHAHQCLMNKRKHEAPNTTMTTDDTTYETKMPSQDGIESPPPSKKQRISEESVQELRSLRERLVSDWSEYNSERYGVIRVFDKSLLIIKIKSKWVVMYRHMCRLLSEVYEIFPKKQMNLDREKSRDAPLFKQLELQRQLGLIQLEKQDVDTEIGMVDNYKFPSHADRRNFNKCKVLVLPLQGETDKQIRESPVVTYQDADGHKKTCDLQDYMENQLLPAIQPRDVSPKFMLSDEKKPLLVVTPRKKPPRIEEPKQKQILRIPQDLCNYKDKRLDEMVMFLEKMLSPSHLKWFKEDIMKYQNIRDQKILNAIRYDKRSTTYTALERVHRKCTKNEDGEMLCEGTCLHAHCPGVECKKEPLLMKSCWYLLDLCDSVDPSTGNAKDAQTKMRDSGKVHPHSNRSQSNTKQVYYKTWRDFCEWYLVAQYELLRKEMFNDQQATVAGLMLSPHLPELVEEFILSIPPEENNATTKHIKIKQILDIIDGGAAHTFTRMNKDREMDSMREINVRTLKTLLKKYHQDGSVIRQKTDLRLSSTVAGKAPQFEHVDGAFIYHREGIFGKIKSQKGKGIVPVTVQRFLLLGLIRSLLGARPGMYGHMAFGTNLKSVNMLATNPDVHHQKPKKRQRGGGGKVDREDQADSYAKGIALEYLRVMKSRVPPCQVFELKYHVFLEATTKSRYGYKNGGINSRILPFHRYRSMLFIVYAASVLYVRHGTPASVVDLAGEFLQSYELSGYDTTLAYQWLEENDEVDFIELLCEHHGKNCRVFYRTDKDFVYGSHASDSVKEHDLEKAVASNVTQMLKDSMKMYYQSLEPGELNVDLLCDGSLFWPDLIEKANGFTTRGVRSATADYIKRLFPHMPEDMKKLLVEQTMMHTLETHNSVYVRDVTFLRCSTARDWLERGAPSEEFDHVVEETRDEMVIGGGNEGFSEPPDELGWNKLNPIPNLPVPVPVPVNKDIFAYPTEAEAEAQHTRKKTRKSKAYADGVLKFLRASPLLDSGCIIEVRQTGSNTWQDFEVVSRGGTEGDEPYASIKRVSGPKKEQDTPDYLSLSYFEAWKSRIKMNGKTWEQHIL